MTLSPNYFGGDSAPKVKPEEFSSWILFEDDDFLVMDKPGWLVCHPSKDGPWSSLVGACRESRGLNEVHLVSRLDRETSGVVLMAKNKKAASFAQKAVQNRRVSRTYLALMEGEFAENLVAEGWLGNDPDSLVFVKQRVTSRSAKAKRALTRITPLLLSNGYTLAAIRPETGRKHQIRVHSQSLGFPLVGEKLYGHDETLYLEFVENGWTSRMDEFLPMPRQALHAATFRLDASDRELAFDAPFPADMRDFCISRMGIAREFQEEAFASFFRGEWSGPPKRIGNGDRLH